MYEGKKTKNAKAIEHGLKYFYIPLMVELSMLITVMLYTLCITLRNCEIFKLTFWTLSKCHCSIYTGINLADEL